MKRYLDINFTSKSIPTTTTSTTTTTTTTTTSTSTITHPDVVRWLFQRDQDSALRSSSKNSTMLSSNGEPKNIAPTPMSKTVCLIGNSNIYNTNSHSLIQTGNERSDKTGSNSTSNNNSSDVSTLVNSVSETQLLFSSLVSAQATLKNSAQSLSFTTTSNTSIDRLPTSLQNLSRRDSTASNSTSLPDPRQNLQNPHFTNRLLDTQSGPQRLTRTHKPVTSSKPTGTQLSPSKRSSSPSPSGTGSTVSARLIDMGKRLLDAARLGQTESVRKLVINLGAPFTSDWLGTTALHQAAMHGHLEIADILLRGGVNRDARTKIDRTALHLAAQSGSLEVVELLLSHGSDIHARDMLKMTPLHWAVERGHVLIVEKLLLAGSDIRARSKFHLAPLDMAISLGSLQLIELLKSWLAKTDITSSYTGITCSAAHNIESNNANFNPASKSSESSISLCATLNSINNHLQRGFKESHDLYDASYLITLDNVCETATTTRNLAIDLVDEACIDLVELEWNNLKFEPEFFLSSETLANGDADDDDDDDDDDEEEEEEPQQVEYLMKVVQELQKENKQLRQKVERMSTTNQ